MANLSKLHVEVTASTSAFARAMDKNAKRVKVFRERVGRAKVALAGMATAALGAAVALTGLAILSKKMFDIGAAVMEIGSKFDIVFGAKASKEVGDFLDNFAHKAGLTITEAKGLIATTAAIAQGMGFSQAESAKFSTEITKVAADLASFNNLPTAEVSMAVSSALTGEAESMKRLGIQIKQEEVTALALITASKEVAKSLTAQERATATLELITKKAGVAMGNLDETMESPANRAKMMAANIRELRDSIAIALMPVFTQLLDKMTEASGGFDEWNRKIKGSSLKILAAFEMIMASSTLLWDSLVRLPLEAVWNSLQMMMNYMSVFKKMMTGDIAGVIEAYDALDKNTEDLFGAWDRVPESFKRASEALKELRELAGTSFTEDIVNVADAVATKLTPDLGDLGKTIETLDEKLRKMTENFTKNFVDRLVKSVSESKNAFAGFFAYMQLELTKLIARYVAFQALTAMFPHSEFIAGITGTAATVAAGGGGVTNPNMVGGIDIGGGTPITGIMPSIGGGGGGGMTVIQNISFPIQAIDGNSVGEFLRQNGGTIAEIVAEASRDSQGYRAQLITGGMR